MSEDGLQPLIHAGSWVRLTPKGGKGVPETARGLDAAVLEAPTVANKGGDSISPRGYESQPADTVFVVRVRDTGEVLEVKRHAFVATSADRGGLVRDLLRTEENLAANEELKAELKEIRRLEKEQEEAEKAAA